MNKEQQELLDEVYKNYRIAFVEGYIHEELDKCLSQEEFIEEIKTDKDFSKTWGLKIEERELTWDERHELAETKYQIDDVDDVLDKEGIPTKLITITYNDKTIESYE